MKFSKQYIRQIISEEIKNALGMTNKIKEKEPERKLDNVRRNIINIFKKYKNMLDPSDKIQNKDSRDEVRLQLEKDLMELKEFQLRGLENMEYPDFFVYCVEMLQGKVPQTLITFIKTLVRGDPRFDNSHQNKLDNYDQSHSPQINGSPADIDKRSSSEFYSTRQDSSRVGELDTRKDRKI